MKLNRDKLPLTSDTRIKVFDKQLGEGLMEASELEANETNQLIAVVTSVGGGNLQAVVLKNTIGPFTLARNSAGNFDVIFESLDHSNLHGIGIVNGTNASVGSMSGAVQSTTSFRFFTWIGGVLTDRPAYITITQSKEPKIVTF